MAASGVWVAYYEDKSNLAIFSSELNALRHANGTTMKVIPWPFGHTWEQAVTGPPRLPIAKPAPVAARPQPSGKGKTGAVDA